MLQEETEVQTKPTSVHSVHFNSMITLTITSFLLAVLYTGIATWRKKQLPESISALVYELPRQWQWVWIVWMWAVSFTACIPLIDVLGEGLDVLGFITIAALVWCGGMPIYMKDSEHEHTVIAIGAGIASQACVLFICPWWLFAWLLYGWMCLDAFIIVNACEQKRWYEEKGVLVAECICALTLYGSIVTQLLT